MIARRRGCATLGNVHINFTAFVRYQNVVIDVEVWFELQHFQLSCCQVATEEQRQGELLLGIGCTAATVRNKVMECGQELFCSFGDSLLSVSKVPNGICSIDQPLEILHYCFREIGISSRVERLDHGWQKTACGLQFPKDQTARSFSS